MKDKNCLYEPSSPISVQEQPSEVDYLNENFQSVGTRAKLIVIDNSCKDEPSSPISVEEQPSEVGYLNKNFMSVETQA